MDKTVIRLQAKLASDVDIKDYPSHAIGISGACLLAWHSDFTHFVPWFCLYFSCYEIWFLTLRRLTPDHPEDIGPLLLIALISRVPLALAMLMVINICLAIIPTHTALLGVLLFLSGIMLHTLVGHGALPLFPWLDMIPILPGLGVLCYLTITIERSPIVPNEAYLVVLFFLSFAIGAVMSILRQKETRAAYADAMMASHNHAAELDRLARKDGLTGIMNRFAFDEKLAQAHNNVPKTHPIGLILIDLDRFKPINDTFGHAAGDAVLIASATRIEILAGKKHVARLGGDEFAVLLGSEDVRNIDDLAQKIETSLKQPVPFNEHHLQVSASIGVATSSDPNAPTDLLYSQADAAMYAMKAQRPNSR